MKRNFAQTISGSAKDMQYVKHARARNQASPYVWNPMPDGTPTPGPVRRTIYSPLDDQPLLVYTINKAPRDSDGCSIVNYLKDPGTKAHAELFTPACLAHDANYEAPWTEIGWKDGRLLCERLLLHDMNRTVNSSSMNEARRGAARIVANTWYNFLEAGVTRSSLGIVKSEPFDVAQSLNRREGCTFTDIKRGGLLSVWNKDGAFVMGVDVTYTSATGRKVTFSEKQPVTKTIVVPISIGARGITISCYAVAGREIFKRSFASPAVMRVVVGGTTLFPTVKENP